MIVILDKDISGEKLAYLNEYFEALGVKSGYGGERVLSLSGDVDRLDKEVLQCLPGIKTVISLEDSYKCSGRAAHSEDAVVSAGGVKTGGGSFSMIAGPCSVESEEQIVSIAKAVKKAGAHMLRGGAFKPRTSPYNFTGLKAEGIRLLLLAKKESGLPIVSEIMSAADLKLFEDVDLLQVGTRNMQNYDLLSALGNFGKPVLLKRGMGNTVNELLSSAEYIMSRGNTQVILCERGIRSFCEYTRNTLDLSAVPVIKELSCLPVIVDPSHATGFSRFVPPMAMAAAACGADGLMIEVHNDPIHALSDGAQALRPEEYALLCRKIEKIRSVLKDD